MVKLTLEKLDFFHQKGFNLKKITGKSYKTTSNNNLATLATYLLVSDFKATTPAATEAAAPTVPATATAAAFQVDTEQVGLLFIKTHSLRPPQLSLSQLESNTKDKNM